MDNNKTLNETYQEIITESRYDNILGSLTAWYNFIRYAKIQMGRNPKWLDNLHVMNDPQMSTEYEKYIENGTRGDEHSY